MGRVGGTVLPHARMLLLAALQEEIEQQNIQRGQWETERRALERAAGRVRLP